MLKRTVGKAYVETQVINIMLSSRNYTHNVRLIP